jgi:hypothetical protein
VSTSLLLQGNLYYSGRISTVDLLVLGSAAFNTENVHFSFLKTSYLNEEVKCTDPFSKGSQHKVRPNGSKTASLTTISIVIKSLTISITSETF